MTPYSGREQSEAKHFILRKYLQELAFKVLNAWDLAYVDGFSGPWESRTKDFSDTSFMIAISVLNDAQQKYFERTGVRRTIRCFFSESKRSAFEQLQGAVAPFHQLQKNFEIKTYCGKFEDAVDEIRSFIGRRTFPLVFIDPTGWTGYPFSKIKPLFGYARCEVLINFMYDFAAHRFSASADEATIASLDPILGGPGWQNRLDRSLPRAVAVEKLFRETLKAEGEFSFVVSTRIEKPTVDRPHFYIAYGTKMRDGLKAFREVEYKALRAHARSRAGAKGRKREDKAGVADLFSSHDAEMHEASIDDIVADNKAQAKTRLLAILQDQGQQPFQVIADTLMQEFILRETNVKDVCVELAREGLIENTWGGSRKPQEATRLVHSA